VEAEQLVPQLLRDRRFYENSGGGITLSGGEPLAQFDFTREVLRLCKAQGLHTCLDTSGSILNEAAEKLLSYTDRVLLDIKYTNEEQYLQYVGCSMNVPMQFLDYLESRKIPVTLRQVIIPTLNDTDENIEQLSEIIRSHSCIDQTELLPFKKLCRVKYDNMQIPFRFEAFSEPSREEMLVLNRPFCGICRKRTEGIPALILNHITDVDDNIGKGFTCTPYISDAYLPIPEIRMPYRRCYCAYRLVSRILRVERYYNNVLSESFDPAVIEKIYAVYIICNSVFLCRLFADRLNNNVFMV